MGAEEPGGQVPRSRQTCTDLQLATLAFDDEIARATTEGKQQFVIHHAEPTALSALPRPSPTSYYASPPTQFLTFISRDIEFEFVIYVYSLTRVDVLPKV